MDVYVSCLCFICLLLYNGSSMRICSLCVPSSQNSTWHITEPQIFIEDWMTYVTAICQGHRNHLTCVNLTCMRPIWNRHCIHFPVARLQSREELAQVAWKLIVFSWTLKGHLQGPLFSLPALSSDDITAKPHSLRRCSAIISVLVG